MNKLTKIAFTSLILLAGCTSKIPILGIDNGQLTPCPDKPNCVNSFSKNEAQYIEPIIISGTKIAVKNDILKVVNEFDNSKVTVTEDSYVRAEFTSNFLRFVDDVEFYFPETTVNNTAIHVRSGARVGYSDLGVNRERVEQLRMKFNALKK